MAGPPRAIDPSCDHDQIVLTSSETETGRSAAEAAARAPAGLRDGSLRPRPATLGFLGTLSNAVRPIAANSGSTVDVVALVLILGSAASSRWGLGMGATTVAIAAGPPQGTSGDDGASVTPSMTDSAAPAASCSCLTVGGGPVIGSRTVRPSEPASA